MPEQFSYVGKIVWITDPSQVDTEIFNEWEQTLKNERARILHGLQTQIPDEANFVNKIAEASAEEYANFVNPNYVDADIIKMKQRVKLRRAYPDWKSGIESAFAEGGAFETNVTNKRSKFEKRVLYTLSLVGYKYGGPDKWGPLAKAVHLITGDITVERYMGANDSLTGHAYNVIKPLHRKFFKAHVMGAGVRFGVLAKFADEAGYTDLRNQCINNFNTLVSDLINALALDNIDKANTYIKLVFDESTGEWRIEAKATTTA